MNNPYKILGISSTASSTQIKKAYRQKALHFHPDKNKSPDSREKFIVIHEAYKLLIDEYSRRELDNLLRDKSQNLNQNYNPNFKSKYEEAEKEANRYADDFELFSKEVLINNQ